MKNFAKELESQQGALVGDYGIVWREAIESPVYIANMCSKRVGSIHDVNDIRERSRGAWELWRETCGFIFAEMGFPERLDIMNERGKIVLGRNEGINVVHGLL